MNPSLHRLFNPKSIAVIGGGTWCENVIRQARKFGFSGPIWPVHPTKSTFADGVTFRSIAALPHPPDAAFIGINRHATITAVAELSQRGAGGAICFASGFQEADDGADLHQKLLSAAATMPILGPNCYGFINYLDAALLWPDQQGGETAKSGVAIITQSSNIAINITMQRRALPLAYIATAGNQAQTSATDIAAQLLRDDRVTALGLHIEGIGDITKLEALAAHTDKPIVVLKTGHSDSARSATLSHTASLAGSEAGARAVFARLGIAQTNTLPEFLEALKLLHITGPLLSNNIVSMSCSGGEAALIADMAQASGLTFPALTAPQKSALTATLGPLVTPANPLDYHTFIWNDADAMAKVFLAMMSAKPALAIIIADFPRADRCDPAAWDCIIHAATKARAQSNTPLAIAASLAENMPEDIAKHLMAQNIAPLCGLNEALTAARIAADCGTKPAASPPILLAKPAKNVNLLTEAQAKSALAQYGLPIPKSAQTSQINDLAKLAKSLTFPLVLKSLGSAHKTEAGAVALNLTSTTQITAAAATMPGTTYLLEEMITGAVAELLIGVVLDPAHGYVLTLAAGGTLAEILSDSQSLMIPSTANDIQTALKCLKIHKILRGYRNQPAADIPAIINATLAIQAYVIANQGAVAEVEINPLLCLPNTAIAADALIRIGDPK